MPPVSQRRGKKPPVERPRAPRHARITRAQYHGVVLVRVFIVLAALGAIASCTRAAPRGFDAAAPEARIDDILDAARAGDQSAVPDLVRQLDSDDPAVRLLAILSLERLTGQRLGYDHAAPAWQREPAVARWAAWTQANPAAPGAQPPAREGGAR